MSIRLPIPRLKSHRLARLGRTAAHPAGVRCGEPLGHEQGVVMVLRHDQGVGWKFFLGNKPTLALCTLKALFPHAPNAQPLALPQGVERKALVPTHLQPLGGENWPGLGWEVLVQEGSKGPLSDKANAGGIFLFGIGQANVRGDVANLGLAQVPNGEDDPLKLVLGEAVQEVALVFGRVEPPQELHLTGLKTPHAGVMTCGDGIGPLGHGVVQKRLELDFGIAQNIWVGGAAGRVLLQELGKDAVFVLGGKVHGLQLNAKGVGHGGSIEKVLPGRAVLALVVVFPVLHENADHPVAPLFEQPGAHRRVNPA